MEVIPTIRTPREERATSTPPKRTWKSYEEYLESPQWRRVRDGALYRAKYRCKRCESKRELQVHHKTYVRLGSERDEDLEVLCKSCHSNHHVREWHKIATVYAAVVSDCLRREKFTSLSDLLEAVKVSCAEKAIEYDGAKVWQAVRLVDANRRGVVDAPKRRAVDNVDINPQRSVTHAEAVAFLQQWGFEIGGFSMDPKITHSAERTAQQIEDWRREERLSTQREPVVRATAGATDTLEQIAEWRRRQESA